MQAGDFVILFFQYIFPVCLSVLAIVIGGSLLYAVVTSAYRWRTKDLDLETIQKVSEYVQNRDWHSNSWGTQHCMVAVVARALGDIKEGDLVPLDLGWQYLRSKLGLTGDQAIAMYFMTDSNDQGRSWSDFAAMDTPSQNTAIRDMLDTLTKTGRIRWALVPKGFSC